MDEQKGPGIDVEELMRHIRAEVKKRRQASPGEPTSRDLVQDVPSSTPNSSIDPSGILAAPQEPAALPPLQLALPNARSSPSITSYVPASKDSVPLRDLLVHDDRDFVYATYRAVMRREPDHGGLRTYLELLRQGTAKVEIIDILRQSDEGRRGAVRIDGLSVRVFLRRIGRWPLLGWLFRIVEALIDLPEDQMRHRTTQGRVIALYEQDRKESLDAEYMIKLALRDVEDGVNRVTLAVTQAHESVRKNHQLIEELRYSVRKLQAEMVDKTNLDGLRYSLVSNLQGKVDRNDFTQLTDYLVGLVQARPTKEDVELLEQAHGQLVEQFSAFREDAGGIEKGLRSELQLTSAELKRTVDSTSASTRAFVDAAVQGVHFSLSSLMQSKADSMRLESIAEKLDANLQASSLAAQSNMRAEIEQTSRNLERTLESLANSKADRASLEHVRAEITGVMDASLAEFRRMVGVLAENAVDMNLIEQLRADFNGALRDAVGSLNHAVEALAGKKADIVFLESALGEIKDQIVATGKGAQESVQRDLAAVVAQASDIKRNVVDQDRRLGLLIEEARKRLPAPIARNQIAAMLKEDEHRLDALYATLEDQFRGTRLDIANRQRIYLPYVRTVGAGTMKYPVIDLGCGRGEWLEVLRDEGFVAKGTDLNRLFVEQCREFDLNVVEEDAVAYLRSLKPASIGAVTSFHMIEHVPLKTLIALVDEALRVLRPNGVLILETPNPANLQVGSNSFYLDPTHRNPLPFPFIRFLLEARGYIKVEILPLHPYEEASTLREGTPEVRDLLNELLFGPRDYAAIAYKS